MSEKKKDLKAFLSKQSKKGKKTTAATETEKPVEEETKVPDEVINKDQNIEKAKKQDSDESEDEEDVNLGFAKIKEMKDIKGDNQQDEIEKKGYGFDEAKAQDSKAQDSVNTKTKKGAGEITFGGGRPMKFGRKKAANQIDGFDEGLDDLDDDGKVKKGKNAKNTSSSKEENGSGVSGAAGGREFINFGSKPREFNKDNKEEESKDVGFGFGSKAPGVKPTFKRREPREFKNASEGDEIRPAYDFKVSYKTNDDGEGEKRDRRPRDQKDKGVPLDSFNKKNENDEDDFTFVTGRQKRAPKAAAANDSDDDKTDGFKIERGDRPNRGRGGFFKNSKKAE